MATITGVEAVRGLVCVYVDGAVALRVRRAHFEKCPLEPGQEVDLEAYARRVSGIQFADGWECALTCLERSARTEKELREALRRRGYLDGAVDAVIQRLRETRLIDDARYAQRLAELQSNKPVGLYAFKRRLRAKGISDDDAEEALSAFDGEQQQAACLEAARGLLRRYKDLPERECKAKLSQALARRGFGWDAIESAVDQLLG